jgi:acetaldehyde dehydrogenase (acetylating)
MADTAATPDRDARAVEDAARQASRAREAQRHLGELTQAQTDAIVAAMARAAEEHAEALAAAAVDETGYGVVADKVQKNLFAARNIHAFIRPMPTVGVIARHEDRRVIDIAEPFGPVAAVVPSTNPTSTAIYKLLIAAKARCAIVLSPHPAAARCITRTAELLAAAARAAGAPDGAISWLTTVTIAGTQALMGRREIAVILATGGLGLVRAAYSAGKPAYGVGPGNAPAYIERSADVAKAVRDIVTGKTFDNGLLCSSENAVVVDAAIAGEAREAFCAAGGYFLSEAERAAVAAALVTPQRLPHPDLVGRSAVEIARRAGIDAPPETRVLIAPLAGVGRDHPLSIEKLCPVLAFYEVADWRAGCERCKEILQYGGMGHTMAIHSRNDAVILEFGLQKPAFRIVVNSPTTHGSIGLTTGLDPALTLGCGGLGGNITSDNISPRHLLNIKRLAYEVRPAPTRGAPAGAAASRPSAPPRSAASTPLDPPALAERIDAFLGTGDASDPERAKSGAPAADAESATPPEAVAFVCEADVRSALGSGRPIRIDRRTIVTPAARDVAAGRDILIEVGADAS